MERVLVYVDWENIHYTLARTYRVSVPPQKCLACIIQRAKEFGHPHVEVFYGDHLTRRELGNAIRACGAYPQPIPSVGQEKNLADTYIATEAIRNFFQQKPAAVVIVSGDNGYTPVLRAIKDEGGEAYIFSFKNALAEVLRDSLLAGDPILLDDLILPHSTPLGPPADLPEPSTPKIPPVKTSPDPQQIVIDSHRSRPAARPVRATATRAGRIRSSDPAMPVSTGAAVVILKLAQALMPSTLGEAIPGTDYPRGWSSDSEEWIAMIDVIHEAVARGHLLIVNVGSAEYYSPNWEHRFVRELLLAWVAFIGKLRYLSSGSSDEIPKTVLRSQICPSEKERALFYSPAPELLEQVEAAAQAIDAVQLDSTKKMIRLIHGHPLVPDSVRLKIGFWELPEPLQGNLRAVERDIRAAGANDSARVAAVKQRFGKRASTIIDLGIALGLMSATGPVYNNDTRITVLGGVSSDH